MDSHITTEAVAMDNWLCPIGRTQTPAIAKCIGSQCSIWRWQELNVLKMPAYISACSKVKDQINPDTGKKFGQQGAATYVNANMEQFGINPKPQVGWCGLGGKPDV